MVLAVGVVCFDRSSRAATTQKPRRIREYMALSKRFMESENWVMLRDGVEKTTIRESDPMMIFSLPADVVCFFPFIFFSSSLLLFLLFFLVYFLAKEVY